MEAKIKTRNNANIKRIVAKFLCLLAFLFASFSVLPQTAAAASLSVSPTSGVFTVGSVFDVSVYMDTENQSVNAVGVFLKFPPDKLQVASAGIGPSAVGVWAIPPKFNNQTGVIELRGLMPGGVNGKDILISTFSFRVKSIGPAVLKFLDASQALLNDGSGANVLYKTNNGVYEFVLPPPAGPVVASPSHPDQSKWYANSTVSLKWAPESEVQGYSYVLNAEPVGAPDDVSEGTKTGVSYQNLTDGIHYFHIKALRNGLWGGVTHFNVRVDMAPPAEFPVEIAPSPRTTSRQPVIQFNTSDALSGLDYYELKIVPLSPGAEPAGQGSQELFIEAQSPYVSQPLELGKYDVIVRAYDKAGNWTESVKRLTIVTPLFQFVSGKGIEIKGVIVISWLWVWLIAGLVILALGYVGWHLWRLHWRFDSKKITEALPAPVQDQLKELQEYRKKYGNILKILLLIGMPLVLSQGISAQQTALNPPLVTTVSRNISNEEIFYVGGKTEAANTEVVIYLQNLRTGETISRRVVSDRRGDWFYSHDAFLSGGNYLLWAQGKIGDELSPPGPQIQLAVQATAIQFGASRLTAETFYLVIVALLASVIAGLSVFIIVYGTKVRGKRKKFMKEIKEAEESVRRGFAVLRRDIEAELAVIKKARLNKELSEEEKEKETQLLRDLEKVEQYISKEVWDVEEAERGD